MNPFKSTLMGAAAAALVLTTTTALAGSGVGGVFNLGQVNTVDAQTSLSGNPGGNPELKVTSTGTAAAVRGTAGNGIGTNGVSISGVGQQGLSNSGIGTLGTHGNTTGINPGVQGETNSTDPAGAGVVGKNNGGGPGLRAIVNAGAPPLAVNSSVKVANLNTDLLDGFDSPAFQKRVSGTCAAGSAVKSVNTDGTVGCEPVGGGGVWSLTGNSGTTPGTNFLGTTDNQPLELKVNGQRSLRIEPGSTSPNLIGGTPVNFVLAASSGATIAGGGESGSANVVTDNFGSVGGGAGNVAGNQDISPTTGTNATVSGGYFNFASGNYSAVGGDYFNTASGTPSSTIAGGELNIASNVADSVGGGRQNQASGGWSTVGGGVNNVANSIYATVGGGGGNGATGGNATVPGGFGNSASGFSSFAAGYLAHANHPGTFVWADSQGVDLTSSAADQFIVRAKGHFFLQSDSILHDQGGFINTTTGASLSTGGTWTNASDRALKHDRRPLDKRSVLEKVARMPITSWSYKAEKPSVRHIGPMAQDFYQAFGLGLDNKHITTIDEGGVALAAIQGLYRENQQLARKNAALSARLGRLERTVASLKEGGRS